MPLPLGKSSAARLPFPAALGRRTLHTSRQVNSEHKAKFQHRIETHGNEIEAQKSEERTVFHNSATYAGKHLLKQLLPIEQWIGESHFQERQGSKGLSSQLTEEQRAVMKLVVEDNQNVFFTGATGTGKAFLLQELFTALATKYHQSPNQSASPGREVLHLSGRTLSSLAGIVKMDTGQVSGKTHEEKLVLMEGAIERMVERARQTNEMSRWEILDVKVLVIDDIHMVDAHLFDYLERAARKMRRDKKPFGGIQVVATGDFAQTPPVRLRKAQGHSRESSTALFCFEAAAWTFVKHQVALTKVFRQNDPDFGNILTEMRTGRISQRSVTALMLLRRPVRLWHGLEPTELFPTVEQADKVNKLRLNQLHGMEHTYTALDGGEADPHLQRKLLVECCAPTVVRLKEGAQVMLTQNLNHRLLVKGALGEVMAFRAGEPGTQPIPEVRFSFPDGTTLLRKCPEVTWTVKGLVLSEWKSGRFKQVVLARRTQVPLIPAWALTIDKAQSQMLQLVKLDLNHMFQRGQVYNALSRVASVDGLQIVNFSRNNIATHPRVQQFYETLSSKPPLLPPNTPPPKPGPVTASTPRGGSPLFSLAQDILSPRPSPAAQSPAARRH